MKNYILILVAALSLVMVSCSSTSSLTRLNAYQGMYNEKPTTVLIMPPINKSMNIDAKEFFHATLNVPVCEAGYYVIPPFISMAILKQESGYDAEEFIDKPLTKFGDVFGADVAMFTIIHKWEKMGIAAKVFIEIEYVFKSIKTNEVIYTRRGNITCDTSTYDNYNNNNNSLLLNLAVKLASNAISTALTKYVDVARICNNYSLNDLPAGKYHPNFGIDGDKMAGPKVFNAFVHK